mmetsp:Transcript_17698/g.49518  ORF Transcript_17698/g.49518 Transcript_17698/m.49518 type:complete len:254 (+) Transcript_17698:559-1320(+)
MAQQMAWTGQTHLLAHSIQLLEKEVQRPLSLAALLSLASQQRVPAACLVIKDDLPPFRCQQLKALHVLAGQARPSVDDEDRQLWVGLAAQEGQGGLGRGRVAHNTDPGLLAIKVDRKLIKCRLVRPSGNGSTSNPAEGLRRRGLCPATADATGGHQSSACQDATPGGLLLHLLHLRAVNGAHEPLSLDRHRLHCCPTNPCEHSWTTVPGRAQLGPSTGLPRASFSPTPHFKLRVRGDSGGADGHRLREAPSRQ